ncbi:MAG: SpoIID/LytB domain-containing protein, partial [Parabacteroides sp.]|nr:SpoIID/LytB domain-containing protein [Parabacteroides sp.]
MKKLLLIFISLILIFTLSASVSADIGTTTYYDPIVKVGLYYGSNAMPSANLANEVGSGYLFGYFDSLRVFIQTGFTATEKITIIKDKTMYVNKGTYYDALPPSGSTKIGSHHIDPGYTYQSFEESATAASELASQTGLSVFPAFISGSHKVRIGHYGTADEANLAAAKLAIPGAASVGGSATCYTVVSTQDGRILYEFDCGSSGNLAITPAGAEKTETWFKGYRYYGSFEYKRISGNDITVINVLPVTEYTKGVVPSEMGPNWHQEALKAQAVCASTYALNNKNKHGSNGFDVCSTTDCQAYRGRNTATANSDAAVEGIRGIGLYYNNALISAVYHSSNGGSTESAKNVWFQDLPYLQAVPDNFEDLRIANNGIWSFEYTSAQLTTMLKSKGHSIGNVAEAYVDEYTPAGNVYRVTFVDTAGKSLSFEKSAAKTILNSSSLKKYANSQRFTISCGVKFNVINLSSQMSAADGFAIGMGGSITRLSGKSDV